MKKRNKKDGLSAMRNLKQEGNIDPRFVLMNLNDNWICWIFADKLAGFFARVYKMTGRMQDK